MTRRSLRLPALAAALALVGVLVACEPTPVPPDTPISSSVPCGRTTATPPTTYDHVVVIMEENRTWNGGATPPVGMGFSSKTMPYLHGLATKCSYFSSWHETNAGQNSLNQYIGLTSGIANTSTVNDCSPSDTCHSTDDNIFRQVRTAGGTARSYVDGATADCQIPSANAVRHVPEMYYWGGTDQSFCTTEVRPLSKMNPDALPTYAMITPNLCHDGHDCPDANVDAFAKPLITKILDGASYKAGKTLVVVIYDEDRPVPNLIIAPTAHAGVIDSVTGSHASLLKTIEILLGLPVMDQGQLPTSRSLRSYAHI